MIQSQVLKADGRIVKSEPSGDVYTLKEWQDAIGGGYVEPVYLGDGGVLLVDEDGRIKGLPLNKAVVEEFGLAIAGDALWMSQSFWEAHQ